MRRRTVEKTQNESVDYIDIYPILRKMLHYLKKYWYAVLLLSLLGGGFMYWRSIRSYHPMYRSEATFSVSVSYNGSTDLSSYSYYYDSAVAQLAASSFPYVLNSDMMKERLMLALDVPYINGSITANSVAETNFFILAVTSSNADDAYRILTAVMDIYPQISSLIVGETQFVVSREPSKPIVPYNQPAWKRSTAIGAAAGLAVSLAVLFILAMTHRTIMSGEDMKKITSLNCMASIPAVKARRSNGKNLLLSQQSPVSPFTEAFRLLRLKLLREMEKSDAKVLLVTSSLPSEGKSSVAANIAFSLAQDGKNVILIDGDLRAPNVKNLLHINEPITGLNDILNGGSTQIALYKLPSANLYVLAGDEPISDPTPLLRYGKLKSIISTLRSSFDYVVLDTPPCLMMSDAAAFSKHADLVVYVVREDYATPAQVSDGLQALIGNGARICGYVLNCVTQQGNEKRGYHNYGYKYGRYGKYDRYSSHYGYDYGKHSDLRTEDK